jgi:hypothetical protein
VTKKKKSYNFDTSLLMVNNHENELTELFANVRHLGFDVTERLFLVANVLAKYARVFLPSIFRLFY